MTLAEMITEVVDITGRPDLESGLITSAVKAATLKAHKTDFYSKDIYETSQQFINSNHIQSLDYISIIPNYRALKYLRRFDTITNEPAVFFTVLTPEEILDKWGRSRTDICYVAGRVIEIRSSVSFKNFVLGCYVLPIVTDADFSSWVADLYPHAIIYEAARSVFNATNQKSEADSYKNLVAEEYAELTINALPDVGF